jgi:hypothetical protein
MFSYLYVLGTSLWLMFNMARVLFQWSQVTGQFCITGLGCVSASGEKQIPAWISDEN